MSALAEQRRCWVCGMPYENPLLKDERYAALLRQVIEEERKKAA
jgi:hypothetical protein